MPRLLRIAVLCLGVVAAAACGDAPFARLGERSSDWVNEPTIVTTTTVAVTIPQVVDSGILKWFNDDLEQGPLDDPALLKQAIFARRAGDLFVQSSRAEIAAVLPGVKFPARAPYPAEYVTSQLVFESSGDLSDDPTVAFGIWSAEPYTRSRSVAQMAVLQVSRDTEAAAQLAQPDFEISCARFADRATQACEIIEIGGVSLWELQADNGRTLIWFDGIYRYELFGRSFVPRAALEKMVGGGIPLSELGGGPG